MSEEAKNIARMKDLLGHYHQKEFGMEKNQWDTFLLYVKKHMTEIVDKQHQDELIALEEEYKEKIIALEKENAQDYNNLYQSASDLEAKFCYELSNHYMEQMKLKLKLKELKLKLKKLVIKYHVDN